MDRASPAPTTTPSMVVSVRVVMTFNPLTPGISGIRTITTSGAAAMVIN